MIPLFEQMQEYGLDGLLPEDLEEDPREEIFLAETWEQRKEVTDCFGRTYEEDEDVPDEEHWDEDNEEWVDDSEKDLSFLFVDDLQSMFDDFCYESQEDFLKLNLWEIIGITKKQMDLVPWDKVNDWLFVSFVNSLRKDRRKLSLDKKILYAVIEAQTSYSQMNVKIDENADEVMNYCERIIDHHTIDDSIELIRLLEDYYRFYPDALEMNLRRQQNNEPVFKYEMFPKPTHLKDLHDKAFRDHIAMETERMNENQKGLNERILGVSMTPDYRRYLYKDEEFTVLPVESQLDLNEEGEMLKHCVASYGSYMATGKSYIYRIRENKNLDTALYTAEIIPEEIGSRQLARLKQCYGYKDTTSKTDNLRNFILKWASEKKFVVSCKL